MYIYIYIGIEDLHPWRWRSVQQVPRIAGSSGLGLLSLKYLRVQQGRMLGSTQGCVCICIIITIINIKWWSSNKQRRHGIGIGSATAMPRKLWVLLYRARLVIFGMESNTTWKSESFNVNTNSMTTQKKCKYQFDIPYFFSWSFMCKFNSN